jgi:hypothetical protein
MVKKQGRVRQTMTRAQASLETVAIFAAVVILVIAVAVSLPGEAQSGEMLRQKSGAQSTVDLLTRTADEIYLTGEGASRQIWLDVPDSYSFADSFIGNKTGSESWSRRKLVSLYLNGVGDVIAASHAPLCGTWPAVAGKWRVSVTYNDSEPPHVMVNGNC